MAPGEKITEDDKCPICGEKYSKLPLEFEIDTYSCKRDKYTLLGDEWRSMRKMPNEQQVLLLKEIFEKNLEEQKKHHKSFLDEYEKDMPGITKEMKDKAIRTSGRIIENYEALLKMLSL